MHLQDAARVVKLVCSKANVE